MRRTRVTQYIIRCIRACLLYCAILLAGGCGDTQPPSNNVLRGRSKTQSVAAIEERTFRLKYEQGVREFCIQFGPPWDGSDRVWLHIGQTYRGVTLIGYCRSCPTSMTEYRLTAIFSYEGREVRVSRQIRTRIDMTTGHVSTMPFHAVKGQDNSNTNRFLDLGIIDYGTKYLINCNGTNSWFGTGPDCISAAISWHGWVKTSKNGWVTNRVEDANQVQYADGWPAVITMYFDNGYVDLTNGAPVTIVLTGQGAPGMSGSQLGSTLLRVIR